tara:strand:- start:263 stop:718 length:456 start_codon:yes stop_codon:yes gene_type:complete
MYNLEDLINDLKINLSKDIKLETVKNLLEKYQNIDWKKYCSFNDLNYKRNLIHRDKLFDIYLICWNTKQFSPIHDHPKNGCLLKILDGELKEELYNFTNDKLVKIKTNILKKNNISYLEHNKVLHKIINFNNKTVSLHIYSPTNYKPNKYF